MLQVLILIQTTGKRCLILFSTILVVEWSIHWLPASYYNSGFYFTLHKSCNRETALPRLVSISGFPAAIVGCFFLTQGLQSLLDFQNPCLLSMRHSLKSLVIDEPLKVEARCTCAETRKYFGEPKHETIENCWTLLNYGTKTFIVWLCL